MLSNRTGRPKSRKLQKNMTLPMLLAPWKNLSLILEANHQLLMSSEEIILMDTTSEIISKLI